MRPLLAPSQVPSNYPDYWEKLQFPLLGSPKLDGIRCITAPYEDRVQKIASRAMSRTWKMLPSFQVWDLVFNLPSWLDGELIEGCVTDFNVYNRTNSHVMSENKPGDISYHIFDYPHPEWRAKPYVERLDELKRVLADQDRDWLHIVPQTPLNDMEALLEYEAKQLEEGYEGIMLRGPYARYKENRATINEGIIYKLKRFEDAEGEVVDFVERQQNNNEQTTDERGYAKRSSHKDNKVGVGMLGKFKVRFQDKIINVGPGHFTHEELLEIWLNRDKYRGRLLKFRYFAHGVKDDPRHARAIGWRNKMDL